MQFSKGAGVKKWATENLAGEELKKKARDTLLDGLGAAILPKIKNEPVLDSIGTFNSYSIVIKPSFHFCGQVTACHFYIP